MTKRAPLSQRPWLLTVRSCLRGARPLLFHVVDHHIRPHVPARVFRCDRKHVQPFHRNVYASGAYLAGNTSGCRHLIRRIGGDRF